MENKLTIERAKAKGTIIFEVYRGSYAYGTYIEGKSDMDKAGVYILPLDDLLSNNYSEQIADAKNDEVYYELGRFLDLLAKNNPNMIELLNVSEDCIIYKHPIMDEILKHKDKFITKHCKNSFGGYVKQQLSKASGLDKKMNKSMKELTTRKNVLDFIYTPFEQGSQHFTTWLENRGLEQAYCGLVSIPNMRYTHAVYYDWKRFFYDKQWSLTDKALIKPHNFWLEVHKYDIWETTEIYPEILRGEHRPAMYKGVVQDLELSNDISLSSVEEFEKPLCIIQFNKDGYSQHCKIFREDQEWLEKRNTARYVDVESHGQMIDGKNMLHCIRLLRMAQEIAEGKGIIVKRPDAEYLIEIRQGKHDLASLQKEAMETLAYVDELFDNSNLPDDVDPLFVQELLKNLRKEFYGIK